MSTLNPHYGHMSATKGVQRRSRVADREDLGMARWWLPKELKNEAATAAKESGLSESLYVELLLSRVATQGGSLPRFYSSTDQELPIADVA